MLYHLHTTIAALLHDERRGNIPPAEVVFMQHTTPPVDLMPEDIGKVTIALQAWVGVSEDEACFEVTVGSERPLSRPTAGYGASCTCG